MNIETVNELIRSLESAGDLSIREQKFLKLAKEFRICSASLDAAIKTGNVLADQNSQLAAENVAMKQIIDSVTNLDNEPQYHDEGMGCGLEGRGITDRYDACRYGWDEAMERIYGEVIPCADELDFSATDAYLAGIKADGVEEFAAKLRIPGDDQFFDALAKGVALAADDFAKQLREGADK
ncbi:hypothetical protein I4177_08565 [Klebsiella pneumoniae]|uniref:hypothetical protein n=1 Tax=Klebsiella pneumoniae TaxID=573 RepID=UPI0018C7BAD5|nr:hypothetical protein [Klebsiella pneumoniae]MBG1845476.1 hypothetical protein [Klebsiella pneumoniae]MDM7350251.1 hypothetical protein [Klebsiella pneumoniae]MDP0845244.1 hypothetical protein [Klebsiella pneumoniae]HCU0376071.1 hypothetical protein [Klebsiella pneumoniae]HDT5193254.1 hypothetical protein [Klebsiella pneumoniae]